MTNVVINMINLIPILTGMEESIEINDVYTIEKEKYAKTSILDLSEIKVLGDISKAGDEYCILNLTVNGKMKINDSVTLEEVWYPFSFEINENLSEILQNDENSLDIIEVLWQNIVLEVPLRYTTVEDYSNYHGDGWKLVSEEELVNNNPFSALLKEKDKE